MSKMSLLIKNFLKGRAKACEFALNNICTAKCTFCSIWQQPEKHMVDTEKALAAVSVLAGWGVNFITFTGGEALLHPAFDQILMRCTKENIISSILAADARLFTHERLDKLAACRVDNVSISLDHHTEEVLAASRRIPGLLTHIEKAVRQLKERGIKTWASVLASKYNQHCLQQVCVKAVEIGFDYISINYPEFSESPVYTLGGEGVALSREEFIIMLEEVMQLRRRFPVVNSPVSMKNIITYLQDEEPPYPCLGGYRMFFVDWFFQVYPCMHLGQSIGNLFELSEDSFIKRHCNSCNMSWYRDFSIYYQGLKSLKPFLSGLQYLLKYGFR